MFQLIYVNYYGEKSNLVFGTMEGLKNYLDENSLLTGEKMIKELKIKFLTDEEFDELAK